MQTVRNLTDKPFTLKGLKLLVVICKLFMHIQTSYQGFQINVIWHKSKLLK